MARSYREMFGFWTHGLRQHARTQDAYFVCVPLMYGGASEGKGLTLFCRMIVCRATVPSILSKTARTPSSGIPTYCVAFHLSASPLSSSQIWSHFARPSRLMIRIGMHPWYDSDFTYSNRWAARLPSTRQSKFGFAARLV